MCDNERQARSRYYRKLAGQKRLEFYLTPEADEALEELLRVTEGKVAKKDIICDAITALLKSYNSGAIEQL